MNCQFKMENKSLRSKIVKLKDTKKLSWMKNVPLIDKTYFGNEFLEFQSMSHKIVFENPKLAIFYLSCSIKLDNSKKYSPRVLVKER